MDISNEDLKASEFLYEKKLYPQSLFYLQQSTEKIVKWIGLENTIIDKKDLHKSIGHNSNLIFKKALEKYQKKFPSAVNFEINSEFAKIKEFVNNNSLETVVEEIVNQIKVILENNYQLPYDLNKLKTTEDLYEILKQVEPDKKDLELLININESPELKNMLDKMVVEFSNNIVPYNQGVLILFSINSLTEKLVTSVRYPSIDDMVNPREIYTENHSIIKALPVFHSAIHYSLIAIWKLKNN